MSVRKETLFLLLWFLFLLLLLGVFVVRSDGAHPLVSLSEQEANDFSDVKIKPVDCEYSLEQ